MKPGPSDDEEILIGTEDGGMNNFEKRGLSLTVPCTLRGLIAGCALIALPANAVEIATKNAPARITINTQPTTVGIWYVDKASSDIAYEWQFSADGTTWSAITGATASTLTLGEAQVGQHIRALASYTDGHGTPERQASAATDAIANLNDAPTGSVTVTGTATLTVQNWYVGSEHRVEQFRTADGKQLLDSQVEQLVQAMAVFAPPEAGQTALPTPCRDSLAPVIAANWH